MPNEKSPRLPLWMLWVFFVVLGAVCWGLYQMLLGMQG